MARSSLFCALFLFQVWSVVALDLDAPGVISNFLNDENKETNINNNDINNKRNLLLEEGREAGDRCGGDPLSSSLLNTNMNTCNDGLECRSPLPFGRQFRCMPRQDCMNSRLREFTNKIDFKALQTEVFQTGNVTAVDVLDAKRQSILVGRDDNDHDRAFVHSEPMIALRSSLEARASIFSELGTIVRDCTLPDNDEDRRLQDSNATNTNTNATERTIGPTVYLGAHLEAGAFLDASFSAFWELDDGGLNFTQNAYLRACGGVELGAGIELSVLAVVSLTPEGSAMDCVSVMIDADAAPLVAVGAATGFCVARSEAVYFDFTLGGGAGGGVGVSGCQAWVVEEDED